MTGVLGLLPWVGLAAAGEVFYIDPFANEVVQLDLREFTSAAVANIGVATLDSGLAYDQSRNEIWVITNGRSQTMRSINLGSHRVVDYGPQFGQDVEIAYDPIQDLVTGYSDLGVLIYPGSTQLFNPGIDFGGADWFDDGGYVVATDGQNGDIYRVSQNVATLVAHVPSAMASPHPFLHHGLAYDSDTHLFVWFNTLGRDAWLVEPETFAAVGRMTFSRYTDGAGGSIDNVPVQTPELLVTGDCPGTMYITAVDATPGGHVQIGSSALRGTKTLTGGPCAGAHLDLRRPAFRADLVANSYGIASTTLQATAPMCGNVLVQALDVGTCMTTSVRTVDWAVY